MKLTPAFWRGFLDGLVFGPMWRWLSKRLPHWFPDPLCQHIYRRPNGRCSYCGRQVAPPETVEVFDEELNKLMTEVLKEWVKK